MMTKRSFLTLRYILTVVGRQFPLFFLANSYYRVFGANESGGDKRSETIVDADYIRDRHLVE